MPNIYVSKQINDRIWAGVAVNVPFGLETNWDPAWVGRFHATKSRVQTINVNPTIAVKVIDKLSIGAGFDYQHLSADFDQVVAYGGISVRQGAAGRRSGRGRARSWRSWAARRASPRKPRWRSPAPRTATASTSAPCTRSASRPRSP